MSQPEVRMRKHHWDALSAFPWADRARADWAHLPERVRRLVLASALAELEASRLYNACRAIEERAKAQLERVQMASQRLERKQDDAANRACERAADAVRGVLGSLTGEAEQ